MNSKTFQLIYFSEKKDEISIQDSQELNFALNEMKKNAIPESINLISPNGDIFTVAIGADYGFVQFESASPNSPYLIAVNRQKRSMNGYREVDAGGTPTPIPERACLQTEEVIKIIMDYFDHLELPNYVEWQET